MKWYITFTLLMAVCCLLLWPAVSLAGSIETQSNPVANGAITVAPGDNDRSDWSPIPFYQSDPAGDAGPELDYTDVQVAHDDNNFYFHFLLNDITPGTPQFYGFRHNLFLDTDQDRATGYFGSTGFLSLGADFLVQGPSYFNFIGASQGDFSWNFLGGIPFDDFPTTDIEISVSRAAIGDPSSFDFVLNGANSVSMTEDYYPDGATGGAAGDYFTYVVPEPSGLLLAVWIALAMAIRRRRPESH